MISAQATQTAPEKPVAQAAAQTGVNPVSVAPRRAGVGLPCAGCKTYYAADLAACPVCQSTERVSPLAASMTAAVSSAERVPDPAVLEEERERFLREFKSQVFISQMQMNPISNSRCVREENHPGEPESAVVCQGCFDRLQERIEVLEAALHIDVREAAQIVYEAVWCDPSDPNKTYLNAAQALLAELRKRSGVTQVFGPLQPLSD